MSAWTLLIYRVPTEPASRRVTIWRQLKRMGGLYLQQCVCLFPARPEILSELDKRAAAIRELGGDYTIFDIPALRAGDEERIVAIFRDLRNKEYAEIVEECETKFLREIEFEHFRQNYSYAETEEIRQDLDKIRRWHKRVTERDWFGADGRSEVEQWIERCAGLLAEFEQEVYRRHGQDLEAEPEFAFGIVAGGDSLATPDAPDTSAPDDAATDTDEETNG